ncbi:hypothetical protein [Nocardioides sp. Soil805]|uniref:hypothetical protein n=1 Tax=Nocardioides sp. Soil805 TaxID=1736416 RepID=UPI000702995F|nr:hypothetical protein [Nocardioides sp. Soil805]KRF37677.1 hypothetical protein ASG94_10390 [Nocardioides sp. Soil805]
MSELYVEYAVMDGATEHQHSVKDMVQDVEQTRAGATIPAGALGKILPSEEIESGFQDATDETREILADAVASCAALADGVELVKKLFIATDENVAERFTAMLGSA